MPGMVLHFLLRLLALLVLALPVRADEALALRAALAAAAARDWDGASLEARAAGPVGADVIEWMRLRAGQGTLGEYEAFLAAHADWPGLPLLHQKGEEAAARSTTPARVIAYFAADRPSTPTGTMALIAALRAAGRAVDAAAEARRAWVGMDFTPEEQSAFLALAGEDVARAHAARTDRLLWDDLPRAAQRMLPLLSADQRKLAEARIALLQGRDDVNGLVKAVPADLQADPGLSHDRFQWRMDKGLYDSAAELILDRSASVETLGDPQAWARRRAALARELAERGEARLAYRVAASHQLQGGPDHADLEFLAGFIALRMLRDAGAAAQHFKALLAIVKTPISLSRAHYWHGRAAETLGDKAGAAADYKAAAAHSSAYYGMLAAERLGLPLDKGLLSDARAPDWRAAPFARSGVLAAARLLLQAGDRTTGKRFLLHLAEGLDAQGVAQLADMAMTMDEPHVALVLAKAAAEQGVILPRYYYPLPGTVPEGLSVSRAFALAISRRESEFDPAVVSPAGAMGLMQVMPGTARDMARKLGLPYEKARLTADPGYNVALGSAYLAQLVEEFGPAVALVAAGYNAGPTRPRRWIAAFGDPRSPSVDVVDWVERIPLAETRTYVMRVAESLVIYRARLKGAAGPVTLTAELTGR